MHEVLIKPISVNQAWQGRRFKTQGYKAYEQELLYKLPPKIEIAEGELILLATFGLSNYLRSDYDNPIKPFQDVLQKKYGFDDSRIKRAIVGKERVKKGQEFIRFELVKAEKEPVIRWINNLQW